jgi:hypothetical protein
VVLDQGPHQRLAAVGRLAHGAGQVAEMPGNLLAAE